MRRDPTPEDQAREPLRRVERDVARRTHEAGERGELSRLPGEGRPLAHDEDEAAGERWAAAHLMRNVNAVPEWADLRREVEESRARLARRVRSHRTWLAARTARLRTLPAEHILDAVRATDEPDRRFQLELGAPIAEVNAKIARHNLLARSPVLPLGPLTTERLAELAGEE